MRLIKQSSGQPDKTTIRPWRCVMPLLGTLAVATIVTVSLPTKADAPRDITVVSTQIQTKAPEATETPEQRKKERVLYALVGAGTVGAAVLYWLLKRIPE